MVALYKRLSTKVQTDTNLAEVLITLKNGNDYFVRSRSGIFVTPDNFRNGEIETSAKLSLPLINSLITTLNLKIKPI